MSGSFKPFLASDPFSPRSDCQDQRFGQHPSVLQVNVAITRNVCADASSLCGQLYVERQVLAFTLCVCTFGPFRAMGSRGTVSPSMFLLLWQEYATP